VLPVSRLGPALLLLPLVVAPLAFGTVEGWSLLLMELLVALALLGFALQHQQGKLLAVPGFLPLVLLVGWMSLQLVPLPVAVLKVLSPHGYEAYEPIFGLLTEQRWLPLSVYRKGTTLEVIRILSYALFYLMAVQLLASGSTLKKTVELCCWLALGIGLLALLQKFSSPEKIYWFRPSPVSTTMGPWVNRSQYSGYVELVAPLVLALALYFRPAVADDEPWRKRVVAFFSKEERVNRYLFFSFGMLVLCASVFVSLSRGGIIAITLSILFFFLLLAWKERRYSHLAAVGFFALLILVVSWFGWQPIVERFDQMFTGSGEFAVDRLLVWEDSWKIFVDFWLTGSGFGTFIAVYPLYRTVPGEAIFDHAHNDYVELLTSGGVIGFALVTWFVIAVFVHGLKMLRRRRDRYAILLTIGALSGLCGMLIHSFTDFNMYNGAVGLYFFFLCAVAVSAGNTRFHYQMNTTLLKRGRWPQSTLTMAGIVLLLAVLVGQGGVVVGRYHYSGVKDIYLSRQLSEPRLLEVAAGLEKAAKFDPHEGLYPYLLGEVLRYRNLPEQAMSSFVLAGLKDPLDGAILQRIGLLLPPERRAEAEVLLEKGAQRTVKRELLLLARVEWLLVHDKRQIAIGVLQRVLIENNKMFGVALPLLRSFHFTREEMEAVLPQRVASWVSVGTFQEKSGEVEEAVYYWSRALDFIDREEKLEPQWFSTLFHHYRKHKDNDKALEILRLGLAKIPTYPRFHEWLGDHYLAEGIVYRAKEEYQQVLLLEPLNEGVRKKLTRLEKPGT
jgi:O-antigen ligase/tetratricopeptide (TPR) repeat protein